GGAELAQITALPPVRDAGGRLPATFAVTYGLAPDQNVPGKMHVYRRRGGRPGGTQFKVLEDVGRYVWGAGQPVTSREQQIQAHAAAVGAPVLGDLAHGLRDVQLRLSQLKRGYKGRDTERPLVDRLALHLSEVTLRHPETREPLTFAAPLPKAFDPA